jgi:hypothetical protein
MSGYTTFKNLRVSGIFDAGSSFSASTLPVTATGTTTARTLAARFGDVFNVKDFGAVGNSTGVSGNGTDDGPAIQLALNAANTAGGGKVYLPKGIYRKADTSPSLIMYSNTTIEGDGDCSVLFHDDTVANPRKDLLTANNTSNIAFKNFKLLGTADTYGSATNISQGLGGTTITNLRCENVTFQGLRFMCTLFEKVSGGIFTGNRLLRCMRDGIRCVHSYNIIVDGNTFENVVDDTVALHSKDSFTEPVGSGFVVSNNTFFACQGIKILGGKRVVVSGNTFSRMIRRAIDVSVEYGLTEGASNLLDVTVSNNVIQDTFSQFGTNEIIRVASYAYDKGALSDQPGVNSAPYSYNWTNNIDTGTVTKIGGNGIRIENNTISRTLPAVAAYSDYGLGPLYSLSSGWPFDPAILDTSFDCHGVVVYGAVRGLRICGNQISGLGLTTGAIRLTAQAVSTYPDFVDVLIEGNVISDCPNGGIALTGGDAAAARNLIIRGNIIDLDPYYRAATHSADNTWSGATTVLGISNNTAITGSVITGNWFAHLGTPISSGTAGVAYIKDNFVLCSPNSIANDALNKGVRGLTTQYEFIHVKYDGDPTSGTYGEITNMPLSTAASIPTTGWYGSGHVVKNGSMAVAAGKVLMGWVRLTTGTGHVSGTDWSPLYCTVT